jgi:hypothetical protein
MLRNPIDVMHAQHSERVVSHMEHIAEFEGALDSQEVRRWRAGPLKGQPVIRLSYRELASFFRQVERYLTVFGRENVYVIVYDDLKRDTAAAFRNTLQFLGVPIDWTVTGEILNANRRVRSMFLQDFLRHSPPLVQRAKRLLPRTFRKVVRSQVLRFNLIYEPRAPMAPMLRKRLQNEVKPEIDQLSDLLQRDLSGWYGT